MQTITDNILLEKLQADDSGSFELLYKFCFPSIASYVKQNLGNNEDAEDIFQEAIIVLLKKTKQSDFVLSSSLKTYLYAVAKNLWLKRLRDNKLNIVNSELNLATYEPEIFELVSEQSREEKVQNWLQKITRNCRRIIKALFFYEVPMDALILKMGWKNKHTASSQKHKCLQQIKNITEKEA